MDTPILPERECDEEGDDGRKLQPRHLSTPYVLRMATAVVVLAGSIVGLVSRVETRHPATEAVTEAATSHAWAVAHPALVVGAPTSAALKTAAAAGHGAVRQVCNEQSRPLPNRGAWTCLSTIDLNDEMIGRKATDLGGPCTHRVADDASGVWNCWTHIAIPALALHMPYAVPIMFGHLLPTAPATAPVVTPPNVCRAESRSSETNGEWTCVSTQQAPDGWRIAEPVDPGGPCYYRIADEVTGVWSCQSASELDAQASGG